MEHSKEPQARAMSPGDVDHYLRDLKLAFIAQHYGELATQAAGAYSGDSCHLIQCKAAA